MTKGVQGVRTDENVKTEIINKIKICIDFF